MASQYVESAILEHSWGYEQTNIDYWIIVKRSGDWLWLDAIGKKNMVETGSMRGTCEPDPTKKLDKRRIRRKLHVSKYGGMDMGVAISQSGGWAEVWNGKPSHWSSDG